MNYPSWMVLSVSLTLLLDAATTAAGPPGASLPTVRVAQDGSGNFNGKDETPILQAIERIGADGGVVLVQPGRYLVRRPIVLPSGTVLQGTAETVLQLPPPVTTTADGNQGETLVAVSQVSDFAVSTTIEFFPPAGSKHFSDGQTESFTTVISGIENDRLKLSEPLPFAVPKAARVGYPHNMVIVRGPDKKVTIEHLAFDGGRTSKVPMPAHHRRCGVWATGSYSYADGPLAPPVSELLVRDCQFQNFYGRGVAMYSVVDSQVTDCTFHRIADEAIDFDHFCLRCRAVGNEVTDAVRGVVLNDASHCLVQRNRLTECGVGIAIWWWYRCPQEGLNEHNTIEHNAIQSPREKGITLGKRCHHNVVRHNVVQRGIHVVEPTNTVEDNTLR